MPARSSADSLVRLGDGSETGVPLGHGHRGQSLAGRCLAALAKRPAPRTACIMTHRCASCRFRPRPAQSNPPVLLMYVRTPEVRVIDRAGAAPAEVAHALLGASLRRRRGVRACRGGVCRAAGRHWLSEDVERGRRAGNGATEQKKKKKKG